MRPRHRSPSSCSGPFASDCVAPALVTRLRGHVARAAPSLALRVLVPESFRDLLERQRCPATLDVAADLPDARPNAQVPPCREVVVWASHDQIHAQLSVEEELHSRWPLVSVPVSGCVRRRTYPGNSGLKDRALREDHAAAEDPRGGRQHQAESKPFHAVPPASGWGAGGISAICAANLTGGPHFSPLAGLWRGSVWV